MAQATASLPLSERLHWDDRIKPWLIRLIFAGFGLLVGLYILAPMQARAGEAYLPASFVKLPTGIVQLTTAEGTSVLLPVRIADTSEARTNGFKGVGPGALDNTFLLYALSRETSSRASYTLQGVRAPLELAAIDSEGNVVSVQTANAGTERASVAEKHRWVLAAKAGTFEHYGVAVGSKVDPESVRKLNF